MHENKTLEIIIRVECCSFGEEIDGQQTKWQDRCSQENSREFASSSKTATITASGIV